jgi:hypothetical protein
VPFDRQGSALPPKKRTKLISVPVDGVNLRVVLLSAAYGSVPDTDRSGELDPIKLPLGAVSGSRRKSADERY